MAREYQSDVEARHLAKVRNQRVQVAGSKSSGMTAEGGTGQQSDWIDDIIEDWI